MGKSHLVRLLATTLGPTAVVVDGADFTEADQAGQRARLQSALESTLEEHGSAQLLFDGFDRALMRTQGPRLQAWLTKQLVDGKHARDLGALFTARCSTATHRGGAGSPLMSRVAPILPPTGGAPTSEAEVESSWFGDAALLDDHVERVGELTPELLVDQFELDPTFLADVRATAGVLIARGTVDPVHDSYAARCAAYGLIHTGRKTRFLERLESSLLASPEPNPAWPEQFETSIDRFVDLIAGADQVLWSDRYMFRDVEPLRSFVQAVVSRSDTEIHLLGGARVSDRVVSKAEMARLTTLTKVSARWMTESDFRDLHERHLVTGIGGWVIPQVHVIVCRQRPGSAVAARTSGFGVDYWAVWERSIDPWATP